MLTVNAKLSQFSDEDLMLELAARALRESKEQLEEGGYDSDDAAVRESALQLHDDCWGMWIANAIEFDSLRNE